MPTTMSTSSAGVQTMMTPTGFAMAQKEKTASLRHGKMKTSKSQKMVLTGHTMARMVVDAPVPQIKKVFSIAGI